MKENLEKDGVLKIVAEKIGVDYEILDYLGGGGLSKIYKVRQNFFGDFRTLKIMDVDYLSKMFEKTGVKDINNKLENIKERFVKEAGIFEKISHPNIARMYEIGFVKDEQRQIEIPYLIMEFIDGITLGEVLRKESPLDIERILEISGDILPALQEIHRENIIHRDIKPANIMIDHNGKAKLIDFGLAEAVSDDPSTVGSEIMGTPAYIAPEITTRSKSPGPVSDIYSFGVVLYEMVSGEKPFEGGNQLDLIYDQLSFSVPNLTKINPKAPPGTRKVLKKAMAVNPDERYRSAEELLAALRNLKEDTKNRARKKLYRYLAASFMIGIIIAAAVFLIITQLEEKKFLKGKPEEVQIVYKTGIKKMAQNKHNAWEANFGGGIVMVYIPAGEGLPGYWLGKTEVTVSQYLEFVKETGSHKPEWQEENSRFNVDTGSDNYYRDQVGEDFPDFPVVGISWDNANAYCRWLSNKTGFNFTLPTEAQWQRAAQGTDHRPYPWGNAAPNSNLANFGSRYGKTTKAGSFPGGASFYGLWDMAGNVDELCDNKVACGGSFSSGAGEIECNSRNPYDASSRNNALGFRLCMTVKR